MPSIAKRVGLSLDARPFFGIPVLIFSVLSFHLKVQVPLYIPIGPANWTCQILRRLASKSRCALQVISKASLCASVGSGALSMSLHPAALSLEVSEMRARNLPYEA